MAQIKGRNICSYDYPHIPEHHRCDIYIYISLRWSFFCGVLLVYRYFVPTGLNNSETNKIIMSFAKSHTAYRRDIPPWRIIRRENDSHGFQAVEENAKTKNGF
jgi:hypothetical protein